MKKAKKKARKKATRKKRNPEILAVLNPATKKQLEKAKRKFREFHGVEPKIRKGKRARHVLIELGRAIDIIYEPKRGDRRRVHWIHKFGPDVRLCTDIEGQGLYIVAKDGVRQVDFSRGIVS